MPQIKNDQDLQRVMEKAANDALEDSASEILNVFINQYVLKYAYIKSPQQYERTNEFVKSWDWTPTKRELFKLSKEMFYDYEKNMPTFNMKKFQHGSKYSSPEDVIHNLMDILNTKNASSLWLSVTRDAPYWDTFINDMFGGTLDKIITKHLKKAGFVKI